MKGVYICKALVVSEDIRRKIIEIQNGMIDVKNMKVLIVKEDSYLGGHWHTYNEVMYMLKGKSWDYRMTNLDTNETEVFNLEEGDVVFRTGRIVHGGMFEKGSIVIDGAAGTYVSRDFNDVVVEGFK